MTFSPSHPLIEIDGRPATDDGLRFRALDHYGHFTAMQVRDGRVRGLALHLARLDSATREMFGAGLDGERVRALLRHALGDVRDASVRVHVQWPEAAEEATVMVTVRPPADPVGGSPVALMSVPYLRTAPHLKHLGDFGQAHYGRLAVRAGFDSALLTGDGGVVAEGAVANICFWDGTSLVWPDAPVLTGITMALLDSQLPGSGVPSVRREVTLAQLLSFQAAFVTNSRGIAPVSRIDSTEFPGEPGLLKTVTDLYEGVEGDRL
ncbi:aminotransferase class IV [Streptomyces sp. NBC_01317]|uniref:aminotransferase class IV n=1 Tax=Streptomyces sp. NBC_01317 TaxID=2903822 RepID=UPI002E11C334|nr:aminotransferase class IV [Streptomyces sp. NBC_01317]